MEPFRGEFPMKIIAAHTHTHARTTSKNTNVWNSDLNLRVCVREFFCARSHSFSCNQNKICQRTKCFDDCSMVDLTILYSTLFTFRRIEYISTYIRISFETNDNSSLRCTWGSSLYVRIAAFHLSQPKWEEKKGKNNQITWTACVCVCFRFSIYVRSSLGLFIHSVCDKKLPVW